MENSKEPKDLYLLSKRYSNKWTLFHFRGKPWGDSAYTLDRSSSATGYLTRVESSGVSESPEEAKAKVINSLELGIKALKAQIQRQEEELEIVKIIDLETVPRDIPFQ